MLARGLEADESYYVRSEPAVRGRDEIDPDADPPPDLAIEVDITRSSLDKQAVYAALGVAELWRYEHERLTVYALQPSGAYAVAERSLNFLGLPVEQVNRFMGLRHAMGETEWVRAFRAWVTERFPEPREPT